MTDINKNYFKIALINNSEFAGGAAIACKRLFEAHKKNNLNVKMIVQENKNVVDDIVNINAKKTSKYKNLIYLALEKLHFLLFEKSKEIRFAFSTALIGKSFYTKKYFTENQIIHLHWFNQGMLSLNGLGKILKNERVVWTLHDMWAFTGGCHYNDECNNFHENCGNCKYLKNPKSNDISNSQFLKKLKIYENRNITFVTCSKWLANEAKKSKLLKNARILTIPNPIDTETYRKTDRQNSRKKFNIANEKFVILFGAASLNDSRKGLTYFIESLKILKSINKIPENRILIALFGKPNAGLQNLIPYQTINLGYLANTSDIVDMYSLSDVYVTTALQDNLPNTVMEALSCSLPVVAFNIGGVPEMVEHKVNGYLADFKSSKQISDGIQWVFDSINLDIGKNARQKVVDNFNEKIISEKYKEVYLTLL